MRLNIKDDIISIATKSEKHLYNSLAFKEDPYISVDDKYINIQINDSEYVPASAIICDPNFDENSTSFKLRIPRNLDSYGFSSNSLRETERIEVVRTSPFIYRSKEYSLAWNGLLGFVYRNRWFDNSSTLNNINLSFAKGYFEIAYAIMVHRKDVEYYKSCIKDRIEPDYSIFQFWYSYTLDKVIRSTSIISIFDSTPIIAKSANLNKLFGVQSLKLSKTPTKRNKVASKVIKFLEEKRLEENGRKKVIIQSSDTPVLNEGNSLKEEEAYIL